MKFADKCMGIAMLMTLAASASVHADSATEVVLYSFGSSENDGKSPQAALIQGSDGNFYGTTGYGSGTSSYGTVFKMTPAGVETILHVFTNNGVQLDGELPLGPLLQASDGNFYGTTFSTTVGQYGGTVFKVTPEGAETVLHAFGKSSTTDGQLPYSGLIQASDGNLYGTTSSGGVDGGGTVFSITPDGQETVLYSFGATANDGLGPIGGLLQGPDGDFYGTTGYGGAFNQGAVFKLTLAGAETILYSFGATKNDGAQPEAGLVLGKDGSFYGTTRSGGTSTISNPDGSTGAGTVFNITAQGKESVLYSFSGAGDATDGIGPEAPLVLGADGNFYGTTADYAGSVFMITPAGQETTLFSTHDSPQGALLLASDGNFYGTSVIGGTQNQGAVFRVGFTSSSSSSSSGGSSSSSGMSSSGASSSGSSSSGSSSSSGGSSSSGSSSGGGGSTGGGGGAACPELLMFFAVAARVRSRRSKGRSNKRGA